MKKQYFHKHNVEELLKKIDGECIPVHFIDHIIIFYKDGDIKQVDSDKIKYYFPNITHTTMNMVEQNDNILEVNVKVDMDKVELYLNNMASGIEECFEHFIDKKWKKYKGSGSDSSDSNDEDRG